MAIRRFTYPREIKHMKLFLIAAIALAVPGAAFAGDLKGMVITDSEMDKVTAGSVSPAPGGGLDTAAFIVNQRALSNADPAAQYLHRGLGVLTCRGAPTGC
jgi:hypothetical protein